MRVGKSSRQGRNQKIPAIRIQMGSVTTEALCMHATAFHKLSPPSYPAASLPIGATQGAIAAILFIHPTEPTQARRYPLRLVHQESRKESAEKNKKRS